MIGGVLPENIENEMNGVVVSIRKEYNVIQIWTRDFSNTNLLKEIEYIIKFKKDSHYEI